ncbi:Protein slit [Schistosoma japonicum]|nr:Protein slit [Schistosoma japonicum]
MHYLSLQDLSTLTKTLSKNCQHEYIYCEELNPCGNGGKCISLPKNNYRCECLTGWIGNDCQINQDDCVYNRCENGATCVDGINEYICKCRPGYAGFEIQTI